MMNLSLHVCTRLVSSPSTNFKYVKTTMDCILFDMNIFWDTKAARVCKKKN